jgi:holo-[acyl-carrier protein] synthase
MFNIADGSTGIGVDIVDIGRFEGLTLERDSRFLNRIFTQKELSYCFSTAKPAQHLAARYAGKEAVVKALSMLDRNLVYKDIEISNGAGGVPGVSILKEGFKDIDFLLSLSHAENAAIAFTVAVRRGEI